MQKLPRNQKLEDSSPIDDNLPALGSLLDKETIAKILSGHFKKIDRDISDCRVSYIRFKPRTSCIITYEVEFEHELSFGYGQLPVFAKLYSEEEYETAVEKTRLHRWANFYGMGEYLLLPDYGAILYFFPNDPVIDGLRLVENPKKIQRILYQHYDKYPQKDWRISDRKLKLDILRYKPERRAVIRFDTRAVRHDGSRKDRISVFGRFYADDSGRRSYKLQEQLYQLSLDSGDFNIARPIAYIPDRRIFMMEKLDGLTLLDCIKSGDNEALNTAARGLAAMHNLKIDGLPKLTPSSLVEKTAASFEMISKITPEFSRAAGEIHETLSAMIENYSPRDNCFAHGDFYPGQVIINDNIAGIIDFDRSCQGDPVADIGNFIAHLKILSIKRLINGDPVEKIFIQSYRDARGAKLDSGLVGFWTAFSLFQLAVNPFRGLEPAWRANTALILKECRALLP